MIRFEDIPELLADWSVGPAPPDWPCGTIAAVEQDSRRMRPGGLFACVVGGREDGRSYIFDAIARGAQAIVGPPPAAGDRPYLAVRDPRKAVALLAARHEGDPSHELDLIGITGTNGKTTTSWIIQSIWEGCSIPTAVLGTLGSGRPGALRASTHTTPEAPRFQSLLRELRDDGYRAVAAEISSHGLDQDRSYATRFRGVVFTNLTRDHLDYHGTFDRYREAKRRLFISSLRGDPDPAVAVVNLDDPSSEALLAGSADRLFGFGRAAAAAVRLEEMRADLAGVRLRVETPFGRRQVSAPLVGLHNGWNLLAAYATALALGLAPDKVEAAASRGVRVPGRMEPVRRGQPFLVLIDYAHTPDALDRALAALRPLSPGKLIVVFGCGGERDQGKRPEMGAVAADRADRVILTNDNPRSEDPQAILRQIEEGIATRGRAPDRIEPDRAAAIEAALQMAEEGDLVLIAGKGHEDMQETAEGRRPFEDRRAAEAALAGLGWDA